MTQHDDAARMRHMLDIAEEALQRAKGRKRTDLDTDRTFELAMTRLLEIIGEAAARVTKATQDRYPRIPWSQIGGLRNRLIHGYDAVDFDVLWKIVEADLPDLVRELQDALGDTSTDG